MITENKILISRARDALTGNWGLAVSVTIIYFSIVIGVQAIPKIGPLLSWIIIGPLILGFTSLMLSISRKETADVEQLFSGFKKFGISLTAYLLVYLFIFLWALLLIIPGIIAAYSYAMTFYILADDDSISAIDAIKKSKKIMNGYKWKFFCLSCRFIGWGLLCGLTLGIGLLWLIPYIKVSCAQFYDDIKELADDAPLPA